MKTKTQTLEDLVELADSGTWGDDGSPGTDSPVLRSTNIADNRLSLSEPAWRVIPTNDLIRRKLATGDIIVTKSSGSPDHIGKCAIFEDPADGKDYYFSNFMLRLRAKKGHADPRWLHYWLTSDSGRFILQQMNSTTTGLRNLSVGQYLQQKLPTPPLPEQRRIADILDKADAIRRKRREAISALDEIKLSQFDQWFSAWFQPQAEKDFVPVSEIVSRFEGGLNVATPESPTPDTRHFILKVSAVTWGDYRPEECKPLPPDFNPPDDHVVRKGDLLFSRANTTELVGATVFVFDTPPNRVLPDKLWRFVWKNPSEVEPLFVWALFNHPKIRYEIGRRATGTSGSMKNISMEKVMSIRVPWPDIETQRRFACFTTEERKSRKRMSSSEHDADVLFKSLVQRAFRGDL